MDGDSPEINVEQVKRRRIEERGRWLFEWRLENHTGEPMRLCSVRVPHGKFKAEERIFAPELEIAAKQSADIQLSVVCNEPPESMVENAFLIFAIEWRQKGWRLFVRLKVKVDQAGLPETRTESITIQEAGFSGIS